MLVIGTSHRDASVDVRGRLARACGPGAARLEALRAACPSVRELLVLATCHRVECYAVADEGLRAEAELTAALQGVAEPIAPGVLSVREGEAAVRHLCRVACGLESVIIGEAEIAGQVRRAATAAREAGTMGPTLDVVLAGALAASGRARSETRIGAGVLSASTAAVAIVERLAAPIGARTVLVIGAGQAGRQALDRLAKRGARRLIIASRSAHHAADAAAKTGAEALGLDHVPVVLPEVDAVIAATLASGCLLTPALLRAQREAVSSPLHVVDLSVPPVVDPAVAELARVTLHTVDDLSDVARASMASRAREVPAAEAIARAEARRTWARVAAHVPAALVARA